MSVPSALLTRFEKAAIDNGFDRERPGSGDWLAYGSSYAPVEVWLTVDGDGRPLVALSRRDVADGVSELGTQVQVALPPGAVVASVAADVPALHRLLRRAYQLARTLPQELLNTFNEKTAALPRTTEAERMVVQRVGQDLFRAGLLDYWDGRCAITGLAVPELLRASHIKPWATCETDEERLDVFNGLLLAPHLDAVFDQGFITVADDGGVLISDILAAGPRAILGLDVPLRVRQLTDRHRAYLERHRRVAFRRPMPGGEL